MPSNTPLLFIITGSRGAGKTNFCRLIAAAAREAGWQVAGLLSNPVFEGSLRTAIEAEDLRSGQTKVLATRNEADPTPGSRLWKFDSGSIAWGNQVLSQSTPCDLLVVDELGPLELERAEGLQAGLGAIDSANYAIALVVIRAELLGEVLMRWDEANLIEIETPEDSRRKASILSDQLF